MEHASTLVATLQAATEGLVWMSEIDAPMEVCHWRGWGAGELTAAEFLQYLGLPPTTPIEVMGVEEWFAGVVEEQDWFGEEERATAQRYRELLGVLQRSLDELRVFRVGVVRVDVYVVGRAGVGVWMGVRTQVVET